MKTLASFYCQFFAIVALVIVLASGQGHSSSQLSCSERNFCCQGKNNTCRVLQSVQEPTATKKTKNNDRYDNNDNSNNDNNNDNDDDDELKKTKKKNVEEGCFCDSVCSQLGDCCHDYHQFCLPVDCVLAEKWSDWTACDVRCGTGTKQRTRRILQKSLNGGKACDRSNERIPCVGTQCKVARAPEGLEQLAETGKIIPAKFGPWRKNKAYDPFQDIRRNLFHHYRTKNVISRPSYCIRFEVTEVQASCNATVSGQPPLTVEVQWSQSLSKGLEVCVECQQLAMHKNLGGRCKGQGVLQRETRWNAAIIPGCHGKWMMKSRQEECQCDPDNNSSFILL